MTDTIVMEELSRTYLETIANGTGYFNSIARDYGTDLAIRKANYCPHNRRYLTIGKSVDIQVKAVTERYVRGINDVDSADIKYALEVKNYNDLIRRANESGICMTLVLCVVVVPNDKNEWYALQTDGIIIRKCAYWYRVPNGLSESNNSSNITISIPKTNIITLDFYNNLFEELS